MSIDTPKRPIQEGYQPKQTKDGFTPARPGKVDGGYQPAKSGDGPKNPPPKTDTTGKK